MKGHSRTFLVSNRLVPNRNVVFNIARSYEQLRQFPIAYRYYVNALEGETNPAAMTALKAALERLKPFIAIAHIETEPPGATLYVDRRDLGPRGTTPSTIGLPRGTFTFLADLEGYESATSEPVHVEPGMETNLKLKLKPILGHVVVAGDAKGAEVHLDTEDAPALCTAPCEFDTRPGRHTFLFTRKGSITSEIHGEVTRQGTVTLRPSMVARTGTLVINCDVHDALVDVDGNAMGFTPTVANIPTGMHRLRVAKPGYITFERTVVIETHEPTKVDVQLTEVEEVTAASRTTENVADAPSSVTIITGRELRAMGYPTVMEAIRGTRGIFLNDDRHYDQNIGIRGIGRLGDFGNHVLVLVDGQSTNDDDAGSSYIDYNARADIDDIERIEIIRGPGSVLYGTGAFLGVINLVTRNRDAPTHAEFNLSTAQNGMAHGRATGFVRFGKDGGIWTSVGGVHGSGTDVSMHELTTTPTPPWLAGTLDAINVGTVNGRVWYKDFTVQWFFTSAKRQMNSALTRVPPSALSSIDDYTDLQNGFTNTRGFLEARYEPKLAPNLQLFNRVHANFFNFLSTGYQSALNRNPTRSSYNGNWGGVEE